MDKLIKINGSDELADEAIRVILRFSTIEKAFKTVDVPQLSPSEKLHNLLLRGNHVKEREIFI